MKLRTAGQSQADLFKILPIASIDFRDVTDAFDFDFSMLEGERSAPMGYLHVQYGLYVGKKGAFKTCHPAHIEPLNNDAGTRIEEHLGSVTDIVAKRWYKAAQPADKVRGPSGSKATILRYDNVRNELDRILGDAKCHFFGNSLMVHMAQYVFGWCSSCVLHSSRSL